MPAHIWDATELSEKNLPSLHTVLFGVFRVADVHLADAAGSTGHDKTQSHVDFIFGSDLENFAGSHRLCVQRKDVDEEQGTQAVQVRFESYACNPQRHEPLNTGLLYFHRLYATALFRDMVGQVNMWLNPKHDSDPA